MNLDLFYRKIVAAIEKHSLDPILQSNFTVFTFLTFLNAIFKDQAITTILKMTRMTLLFEAFFHTCIDNSLLKKELASIRLARWHNHYGMPTITFLLTYHIQIEQTKRLFDLELSQVALSQKPWELYSNNFVVDEQNDVIVNKHAFDVVPMPKEEETRGKFLKTHNPIGGYTTIPCDAVSQKFIEYASNGKTLLEIGAAFGAASLQSLANGATVFCNDIESNNLAVVRNRYQKKINDQLYSVTGDDNKLILVPGAFPDELKGLPENFFDSILICRVLHFLTGSKIEQGLQQLFTQLKPRGKLFVVCETPFLKNWQRFIPEYKKRIKANVKWPGEITDPANFESSGRITSLPKFVHWISKEMLERSLTQSKFEIEHLSYIDRYGQFPDDLLLDGRESIGAIAIKPHSTEILHRSIV